MLVLLLNIIIARHTSALAGLALDHPKRSLVIRNLNFAIRLRNSEARQLAGG